MESPDGGVRCWSCAQNSMAEGEGFEPPDLSVNDFQDRRLKPLGHPSAAR